MSIIVQYKKCIFSKSNNYYLLFKFYLNNLFSFKKWSGVFRKRNSLLIFKILYRISEVSVRDGSGNPLRNEVEQRLQRTARPSLIK